MLHRGYVSASGLAPNVTFSLLRRSSEQANVQVGVGDGDRNTSMY
jgi:hypothetical protein